MSPQKYRWFIVALLLSLILIWAMGQYDYERLVAGKRPLFARLSLNCSDGGSVQYWGLGYTVTKLHELRWGIEIPTDVITNASYRAAPYAPYRIGETLTYWTPFVSRDQTYFTVETNN